MLTVMLTEKQKTVMEMVMRILVAMTVMMLLVALRTVIFDDGLLLVW